MNARNKFNRHIPLTSEERLARKKRRRKRTIIGLLTALAVLIVIRLIAPPIAVSVVNKKLDTMPDYKGHIRDIDLSILTGSCIVKDMTMTKKNGEIPVPFVSMPKLKVAVEWDKLFKKGVVLSATVMDFEVNLVKGPTPETSQMSADPKWLVLADELLPVGVNTMTVEDGRVNYFDSKVEKKPALVIDSIRVKGTNLTNAEKLDSLLPSKVFFAARCVDGTLVMNAKLNLQKEGPDADLDAKLTKLPLVEINPLLRSYAKFDVQKGYFDLYTEMAVRDGKISGYAKPLIKDLEIQDLREEKKEPLSRRIWEAVLEVAAWIFKNKPENQVATRVEIEGKLKNPQVNVWQVIVSALSNAFVQALMPGLEQSININTINIPSKEKVSDKPKNKKHKKRKK